MNIKICGLNSAVNWKRSFDTMEHYPTFSLWLCKLCLMCIVVPLIFIQRHRLKMTYIVLLFLSLYWVLFSILLTIILSSLNCLLPDMRHLCIYFLFSRHHNLGLWIWHLYGCLVASLCSLCEVIRRYGFFLDAVFGIMEVWIIWRLLFLP